MKKRGQFTILIVLAIVVVAAVLVAVNLNSWSREESFRNSAENALGKFMKSNSLDNYVSSCLESVSEEAVLLAASQGGNLWKFQGGPAEFKDGITMTIEGMEHKVPYVLEPINSTFCPAIEYEDTPFYPYPFSQFQDYSSVSSTIPQGFDGLEKLDLAMYSEVCSNARLDTGFFGARTTRAICMDDGPNNLSDSACQTHSPKEDLPIQYQLANYTEKKINNCLDFTELSEVEGFDIEILNEPNISYVFGDTDLMIKASYPVIAKEGDDRVRLKAEFSHKDENNGFRELYEYFSKLVKHEAWYKDFDPENYDSEDHPQLKWAERSRFEVDYKTCPPDDCTWFYDVLEVTDNGRTIAGKKIKITGLVKNRPPILDFVANPTFQLDTDNDGNCVETAFPFIVNYADPDGGKITPTLTLSSQLEYDNLQAFAGQVRFDLVADNHGTYSATLKIKDKQGLEDQQNFEVEITTC